MDDKNKLQPEKQIEDHFKQILEKDKTINKELDNKLDVDVDVNSKPEEDDVIAKEC